MIEYGHKLRTGGMMDLPDYVVDLMWKVVDDHPNLTHAAVFTDALGGYDITYVTSKERAEELTAGQANTEVVEFKND